MKRVKFSKRSPEEWLANTTTTPGGCMEWNGTKDGAGYAVFDVDGKWGRIGRAILGLTDKSVYACHRCDNPACINPAHLFAGTQSENIQDHWNKVKSGRVRRYGYSK